MRSFQVCRCGEPMQFAERIDPKPVGHEVLLKVLAAGVCHSDLHIWEGFYDLGGGKKLLLQERGVKLPLTMGHENVCLLYTSDAADDLTRVDLGGRRIIKKK